MIDLKAPVVGENTCAFCKRGEETGEPLIRFEEKTPAGKERTGRRAPRPTAFATKRAMWAPLTVCNDDGTLANVCGEVQRASRLRCFVCKKPGAAAGAGRQ